MTSHLAQDGDYAGVHAQEFMRSCRLTDFKKAILGAFVEKKPQKGA